MLAPWRTDVGRDALAAGLWVVLARLAGGAGRTIRSLVLARLLVPADFGVAALAVIAIETLETCTSPGLEPALVQRRELNPRDLDYALTIQLVRGIVVAGLAWTSAPLIAGWFNEPRLTDVLRWLSAVPVLRGLVNPGTALLVRALQFRRLFVWEIADTSAALVVGVALAAIRPDVTALVGSFLAGQSVRTLFSWIIAKQRAVPRAGVRHAVALLRFGRWVLLANILMLLNVQGEHALVGAIAGTTSLGLYQMAARLAELPIVFLVHPAVQASFPALCRIRDDHRGFANLYFSLAAWMVIVCCAWLAVVTPLAREIVRLAVGDSWLPSAPLLRIMALTTVFRTVVVFGQPAFYALDRPALHVQVNAVRLVAITVALVVGVRFGLGGIALSVLAGTICAAAFQLWLVRRTLRAR